MSHGLQIRVARLSTAAAASMLLWISRTLLGLLLSYPVVLAIQSSSMSNGPDGDAVLFHPGSLLLLELLRIAGPWLGSALRVALLLALLSSIFELIPLALAFDLLRRAGRPLRERLSRAVRLFPKFLALSLLALLAQAALLLAASLLGGALKPLLASGDERLRTCAPLALIGLGLIACGGLGAVLDIARATLVDREPSELGARSAFAHALLCLRKRPWQVLLGAYASVAGGALGYLSAAWLLTRPSTAGFSNTTLALTFAAHQLAVLCAIAWRVRWLAAALELSLDDD